MVNWIYTSPRLILQSFKRNNNRPEIIAKEHDIILNHPNEKIEIKADRDQIKQVIANMIDNAIKYSPAGTEINIDTSVKENGIIVKIKDNGIGIKNEYLDKIFNRFFRVSGIASTFPGVGLGLYVASEIMKRHGGKMWVESKPDKGSVFYIEIPKYFSDIPGKTMSA